MKAKKSPDLSARALAPFFAHNEIDGYEFNADRRPSWKYPEFNIYRAVMRQTCIDLFRNRGSFAAEFERYEALCWIRNTEDKNTFSFVACCDAFDVEPDCVRKELLTQYEEWSRERMNGNEVTSREDAGRKKKGRPPKRFDPQAPGFDQRIAIGDR